MFFFFSLIIQLVLQCCLEQAPIIGKRTLESKYWLQRDMNSIMKVYCCYLSISLSISFFLSPYFPPELACQVILYLSTFFILCFSKLKKSFQIKSETQGKFKYHENRKGTNWFDTEICLC